MGQSNGSNGFDGFFGGVDDVCDTHFGPMPCLNRTPSVEITRMSADRFRAIGSPAGGEYFWSVRGITGQANIEPQRNHARLVDWHRGVEVRVTYRVEDGREAYATLRVGTPVLKMYLDADRDGAVDPTPANYGAWRWGAPTDEHPQPGGILLVPKRRAVGGARVVERSELRFDWGEYLGTDGWTGTLEADHPNRIRVYPSFAANAVALNLGGGLDLTTVVNDTRVGLWLAAADYGGNDEATWRVRLTFRFRSAEGDQVTQVAELRIAPWVMAGDLDPTQDVFAVAPEPNVGVSSRIEALTEESGATFRAVAPRMDMAGRLLKPFLRDRLQAGYAQAPHDNRIVVLDPLDDQSPYAIAANLDGVSTAAPGVELTSQANGGNLLVTPPTDDYPLGRIVYGHNADSGACNLRTFFRNQLVQRPIELDASWLSVGHVDEVLSFLPDRNAGHDDAWPWRLALLSPRLGYILAYAASAQRNSADVDALIDRGLELCEASRQANEDWAALRERCNGEWGGLWNGPEADWTDLAGPGAYQADAGAPARNGRTIRVRDGEHYSAQSLHAFLGRAHPAQDDMTFHQALFDAVRGRIDGTRATLLQELGAQQRHVLEVPVLLGFADSIVTETADSVNMLVLHSEDETRCLVPKPFGPVCGGQYIFQRHLERQLAALGVTAEFANDWLSLHARHGEIHCGTNQIPPVLPPERAWWLRAPPP